MEPNRPFKNNGTLPAAGGAPAVKLGQTSLEEFQSAAAPGAAVYYALYNAKFVGMAISACSSGGGAVRLVVFSPQGLALW